MMVDTSSDDFGCIINSAIRYACGRSTYVPFTVHQFVGPLIPDLTDATLVCALRDIDEHSSFHNLGSPCDALEWHALREKIQAELVRRNVRFEG